MLKGFSLEVHKPRIVIIEDNSVNGDPHVARRMSDRGYVHFRRTGVNGGIATVRCGTRSAR